MTVPPAMLLLLNCWVSDQLNSLEGRNRNVANDAMSIGTALFSPGARGGCIYLGASPSISIFTSRGESVELKINTLDLTVITLFPSQNDI